MRYVGDHVAFVVAETKEQAKAAAELVHGRLWRAAGSGRRGGDAKDRSGAGFTTPRPNNTVFQWALGDKAATDSAFARAGHVTQMNIVNNRLIPNAIEPRAAIGSYDSAGDHFTLYTTSQNPHVARLVISAFVGIAPENRLRVIAPDVGGGFGSKIFIYAEEVVCLWASKRIGGRPVKWTAERTESFQADAHGRDHVTEAEMAMDERGKIIGAAGQDHRQYGRIPLNIRKLRADLSLRHAPIGPV